MYPDCFNTVFNDCFNAPLLHHFDYVPLSSDFSEVRSLKQKKSSLPVDYHAA